MTTEDKRYTLKEARELLGLSRRELSKVSGISMSAITDIEKGSDYKTHQGVALALAEALCLEVHEIKWPRGLSHLGRPPKSGIPIKIRRTITFTEEIEISSDQPICPRHFLTLPANGQCDFCS